MYLPISSLSNQRNKDTYTSDDIKVSHIMECKKIWRKCRHKSMRIISIWHKHAWQYIKGGYDRRPNVATLWFMLSDSVALLSRD